MNETVYDIAIVGAGAAGLMAALPLAAYSREHFEEQPPVSVALIERNGEAGRKLAKTGNHRCNFTNMRAASGAYDTDDEETLRAVLNRITPDEVREIFAQYGIPSKEEGGGRVYPDGTDAEGVAELLELGIESEDVERICHFAVQTVERIRPDGGALPGEMRNGDETEAMFRLTAENGRTLLARNVILATGGKADPKSGSRGDGYRFARAFGHSVRSTHPALVRLRHADPILASVRGVRVKGTVELYRDGELLESASGEIQLNPGLLSGICVMDVSHNVFHTDSHSFDCVLTFDGTGPDGVPKQAIPERLRTAFAEALGEDSAAEYLEQEKPYTVAVTGTQGWKEAQVTAGGVSLSEVDPLTLESKLVPGLFFAGEILDVTGPCGGYNLHWAWTSGFLAGMSAMKRVIGERNVLELQLRGEDELAEEALL